MYLKTTYYFIFILFFSHILYPAYSLLSLPSSSLPLPSAPDPLPTLPPIRKEQASQGHPPNMALHTIPFSYVLREKYFSNVIWIMLYCKLCYFFVVTVNQMSI